MENGDAIDGLGIVTVKEGNPLTFCNTLHVPSLKTDLVSMVNLAKKGCSIVFKEDSKFDVVQDWDVALSRYIVDGLMELC